MTTATKIREYIEEFVLYGENLPSDDDSLLETGVIDSTGAMELVMFLEDTFGIAVPNEEIGPETLDTVNLAAALVDRLTAQKAA